MTSQENEILYLQGQERKKKAQEIRMINEQVAREQKDKDKKEESDAIKLSEQLYLLAIDCLKDTPQFKPVVAYLQDINCKLLYISEKLK